jgi:organic radical activating enzyme
MAQDIGEAPFLGNIGFLITYKCQVACPHCVIHAGPNRDEEMALSDAFSWIDQASTYRDGQVKAICFTGGEPFYDLPRLKELVRFTTARGLLSTVVTNAFWAESRERAREVLDSMKELRVISISADPHHQLQIPFERVRNALLAVQELGLIYRVAVCTENENDPAHRELIRRLRQIVDADKITVVITFSAGRALATIEPANYEMSVAPPDTACPGASTPTVFPDGRVYACIGPVIDLHTSHPLLLGNLRDKPLAQMLDEAELNPILHLLRVWGPVRLLALLEERGHGARLPKLFVRNSMCNLCWVLMADSELCAAMKELAQDSDLAERTAYARLYYLNETKMLELK